MLVCCTSIEFSSENDCLFYDPDFVQDSVFCDLIRFNIHVYVSHRKKSFISPTQELADTNKILKQVFLLLPQYCLGRGLFDMAKNQLYSDVYARLGVTYTLSPFKWDQVGRNLFSMFMLGILFFIVNLLIEYSFFIKFRQVFLAYLLFMSLGWFISQGPYHFRPVCLEILTLPVTIYSNYYYYSNLISTRCNVHFWYTYSSSHAHSDDL